MKKQFNVGEKIKIQFPAFEVEYTIKNGYRNTAFNRDEILRFETDKLNPINGAIEEIFNNALCETLIKHFSESDYEISIGGQAMVGVPMNISIYKK